MRFRSHQRALSTRIGGNPDFGGGDGGSSGGGGVTYVWELPNIADDDLQACEGTLFLGNQGTKSMPVPNFATGAYLALRFSKQHPSVTYRLVTCDTVLIVEDGKFKRIKHPDPVDPDPGEREDKDPNPPDGEDDRIIPPEDDHWGTGVGDTEPAESDDGDDGLTDAEPVSAEVADDSLPFELPSGDDGIGQGVQADADDQMMDTQPTAGNQAPQMGQEGYGDYYVEFENETLLTYGHGSWQDFEGNVFTYDSATNTFHDLNGAEYTYSSHDGNIYLDDVDASSGSASDFLEPDWNTPESDDWVDSYGDLPTDEDGETDFSGTFGLDDGE